MLVNVKLELGPVKHTINSAAYQEAWEEHCNDNEEVEDGDYPPITKEFVLEKFQEDVESGELDIAELFESASVEVTEA